MAARLSALDTSFLHFEDAGGHMHIAALMLFDGAPPSYEEVVRGIEHKLEHVPRYRQRLAHVPFGQGRPCWVDDPFFNINYHVRHTAVPAPGGERELQDQSARLLGQRLDRTKPLWEIWMIEGLEDGGFALLSKAHHSLVDGVSGVDIASLLLDIDPDATLPDGRPRHWAARPVPSDVKLLADAVRERTGDPGELFRGVRAATRRPRRTVSGALEFAREVGALAIGGGGAPKTPLNVPIGHHRRYTWIDGDLRLFKEIKNELGGTLNDVVLTSVALGLGRWLRGRGVRTDAMTLRAMVPVSVRAADQQDGGNRVATMWADLPVSVEDPERCFATVRTNTLALKASGQAIGARRLTELANFAPPTLLSQAARLQPRQRYFNVVVTNIPGPQIQLYLMGRPMRRVFPVVPLAQRQALGIAIVSYNGHLGYGLTADYDALPDLENIASHIADSIDDLARASGAAERSGRFERTPTPARTGRQRRRRATR